MESAEPDLKSSQVTVKGALDPSKLVEYVYKRTGKHAVIVKQEPDKKEGKEENKEGNKDEKKAEEGGEKDKKGDEAAKAEAGKEDNKDKKEGESNEGGAVVVEENKTVELKMNEYNYYPPRYAMEFYAYHQANPPPQIFSDENPNACSVM